MSDLVSVQVKVHGRVQGVFFRDFTRRHALKLGISGYVSNLPDGKTVSVQAEGEKAALEKLIGYLRKGPPGAAVEKLDVSWSPYSGDYSGFSIRYTR
jgi:acylphosphatase